MLKICMKNCAEFYSMLSRNSLEQSAKNRNLPSFVEVFFTSDTNCHLTYTRSVLVHIFSCYVCQSTRFALMSRIERKYCLVISSSYLAGLFDIFKLLHITADWLAQLVEHRTAAS